MVDVDKQIQYWQNGSDEDLATATYLLAGKKTRPALFYAHLALEKLLKSQVCKTTRDLAPRIHNLRRLAGLAKLEPCREHLEILARMSEFNIEGRYPEMLPAPPTQKEAAHYMNQAKEVFEWLRHKL
jgi:HEPN domain-containing protein